MKENPFPPAPGYHQAHQLTRMLDGTNPISIEQARSLIAQLAGMYGLPKVLVDAREAQFETRLVPIRSTVDEAHQRKDRQKKPKPCLRKSQGKRVRQAPLTRFRNPARSRERP